MTLYIKYFWFSGFFSIIYQKCHPPKKSIISISAKFCILDLQRKRCTLGNYCLGSFIKSWQWKPNFVVLYTFSSKGKIFLAHFCYFWTPTWNISIFCLLRKRLASNCNNNLIANKTAYVHCWEPTNHSNHENFTLLPLVGPQLEQFALYWKFKTGSLWSQLFQPTASVVTSLSFAPTGLENFVWMGHL